MLRVYLFGGLEITWNERSLPALAGGVARSLLAYLLTYHDRPHTRDLLAGTFWPDRPDATARRRLTQALWQIRRSWRGLAGAVPLLLTTAGTVQLHPALPFWSDGAEFCLQHARCAAAPPDSPESLAAGARCAALCRGDFLPGYYDDWVLPEREALRDKLLLVLERQIEGRKGCGDYEGALDYARRLVVEAPWREEAHREIMRLHHILGDDDEALRQYEVCCQVLSQELASSPLPDTVALAEEIAARAGRAAPVLLPTRPRPLGPPRLERPDRLPLAGRRAELAVLVRQLESAVLGNGGLVIVYGEAGVGKSRLLRELAANAQWRGVRTAWGRCYELAAPLAYQPLVEALRAELAVLRAAALPSPWSEELARLLPEMAGGGTPPPVRQEEAGRLLEALAQAFLALAAAGPLLVILEDTHWMDRATLAALRYLLPRLAAAPLLIVLSARPEELAGPAAAMLAALEDTRLPHRLSLARLDETETMELVQRALDLPQPAPRFSARLYTETEGHPFFLVETLWALVQEGVLTRDQDGMWGTPWDESTADYAELPLPAGVVQSIVQRLERLPLALREPLNLAAVIGREVDFCLWLAAGNCPEPELLAAGDELCRRGLLLAAAGSSDYTFAHDLIRRVAYERLSAPRRRAGHRQVAAALTRLASAEPAVLAYHWTRAEVWDQAVCYHRQAGDRARAVYANAAAAEHYTRALESLSRLPEPVDPRFAYDLHLARESVHHLSGARQAQAQDLQVLAALAEALADDERRAEAALRRASYANATGDFPVATAAACQAVGWAAARGEPRLEAEARRLWGQVLLRQGDYAAARFQLEQALALAHSTGLRQVEADSLRNLGVICWYLGDSGPAQSYFEQARRIYGEIGDRLGESRTLNNLGLVAVNRGDYLQARACFEQCLRIDRQIGERFGESLTLGNLGSIAADFGDHGGARRYYEQALQLCRMIGNRQTEAVQLGCLGLLCHCLGDHEAAREYGQQVLRLGNELGDRVAQAYGWTYIGHAQAGLGLLTEAAGAYQQALAIRRELGQSAMAIEIVAGLARVALAGEELSQAQEHVGEILRYLETTSLEGADEPLRVYLSCYRVLQASQDPRAEGVLSTAYHLLQERVGKIVDAQMQRSFLENVIVHREIVAAYRAQQTRRGAGPPADGGPLRRIELSLPRADAPSGRPLRSEEYVVVTWTLHEPGDEAVAGKTARRQRRLLRLLAEAHAQGARPRDEDLAQVLEVGLATVRRDVAALRAAGHALPPRRRG